MAMLILAENPARGEKYIVKGDLAIQWSERLDAQGHYIPELIDATGVQVTAWKGPTVFKEVLAVLHDEPKTPRPDLAVIMAYDLNGDGLSELVAPILNRLYWNRGGGVFEPEPLWAETPPFMPAGVIAQIMGHKPSATAEKHYKVRQIDQLVRHPADHPRRRRGFPLRW